MAYDSIPSCGLTHEWKCDSCDVCDILNRRLMRNSFWPKRILCNVRSTMWCRRRRSRHSSRDTMSYFEAIHTRQIYQDRAHSGLPPSLLPLSHPGILWRRWVKEMSRQITHYCSNFVFFSVAMANGNRLGIWMLGLVKNYAPPSNSEHPVANGHPDSRNLAVLIPYLLIRLIALNLPLLKAE